jgi:hypothetical protein
MTGSPGRRIIFDATLSEETKVILILPSRRLGLAALASLLLLPSCGRKEEVLRVGMTMDGAMETLRRSGAREEALAQAPPLGGAMSMKSFEIAGDRLVTVIADRGPDGGGGVVMELQVCGDPEKLAGLREWKKVSEVPLGTGGPGSR